MTVGTVTAADSDEPGGDGNDTRLVLLPDAELRTRAKDFLNGVPVESIVGEIEIAWVGGTSTEGTLTVIKVGRPHYVEITVKYVGHADDTTLLSRIRQVKSETLQVWELTDCKVSADVMKQPGATTS